MKKNIDELVREKLSGHKAEASRFLWYKIAFRRFLQTFFGKTLLYVLPVMVIAYLIMWTGSPATPVSQETQSDDPQSAYFRDAGNEYAKDDPSIHTSKDVKRKKTEKTENFIRKNETGDGNVYKRAKVTKTKERKMLPVQKLQAPGLSKQKAVHDKTEEALAIAGNNVINTKENETTTTSATTPDIRKIELSPLKGKSCMVQKPFNSKHTKFNTMRPVHLGGSIFQKIRNVEVSFYFNPAITKTLFSKNEEFQKHISVRREAEKDISSYSGGITVRKYYKTKFFGELGLDFTLMDNRVRYHTSNKFYDPENSYYIIDTTWFLFINEGHWDSIPQYDSTFYPVYVDRVIDKNVKQKYQYISIPVLGGISFKHKNINIDFSTGISVGWINTIEGEILNYDNKEFIALPKVTQNIMIQHIAKLRISYEIYGKMYLYIAPQYRMQLNTLNTSNYPIHTRLINYGISTGIAIKL